MPIAEDQYEGEMYIKDAYTHKHFINVNFIPHL